MRILINGKNRVIRDIIKQNPLYKDYLGILHAPYLVNQYYYDPSSYIAADNGAFINFNPQKYLRMLYKIRYENPKWVTCPDIVGNAKATLDLFYKWYETINEYNIPIALVAQDGVENIQIPWKLISCIFIGGTTGFKYSKSVIDIIKESKKQNKLVHIGRVNTIERIKYFYPMKPDSFDGTGYSRYTNQIIEDLAILVDLKIRSVQYEDI